MSYAGLLRRDLPTLENEKGKNQIRGGGKNGDSPLCPLATRRGTFTQIVAPWDRVGSPHFSHFSQIAASHVLWNRGAYEPTPLFPGHAEV
jgi:hypothetical protein